jgi:hypothetical protein
MSRHKPNYMKGQSKHHSKEKSAKRKCEKFISRCHCLPSVRWWIISVAGGRRILCPRNAIVRTTYRPGLIGWETPGRLRIVSSSVQLYTLRTCFILVSLQVFTATSLEMTVFCNTAPCSLSQIDRRFSRTYCPYHRGDWIQWSFLRRSAVW